MCTVECAKKRQMRGASLIEFALVLPVFLALIVGILFYGIAFTTQQAVNFAAERGAETAVSVDPDSLVDSDDKVNPLVNTQANSRIRSVLGYFPGVDNAFPANGSKVAATKVADASECGNGSDDDGSTTVNICVISTTANAGSRRIQVRLSPKFQDLLRGFPQPGFFLTPEFVRATGSAVVAEPSDGNAG